jgi:hypothetical protein
MGRPPESHSSFISNNVCGQRSSAAATSSSTTICRFTKARQSCRPIRRRAQTYFTCRNIRPLLILSSVHHPGPQAGRDRPEKVVAINRNTWSQSCSAGTSLAFCDAERHDTGPVAQEPIRTRRVEPVNPVAQVWRFIPPIMAASACSACNDSKTIAITLLKFPTRILP